MTQNSKLSDLAPLDATSVTNNSSVSMFADVAGTGKLLNADIAASIIGQPLGAVAVRSTDFGIPLSTETTIQYEATEYDALGYWDAASNTILHMPYAGWVQIGAQFRFGFGLSNEVETYFSKNGAGFAGNPYIRYEVGVNPIWQMWSSPIVVASGDYFEVNLISHTRANTLGPNIGKVWFSVNPISIWLP